MRRSYRLLAMVVLVGAAAVLYLGRSHHATMPPEAALISAPVGRSVALEISGGAMLPARVEVPKGATVTARIVNRDATHHRVALLGYESAVSPTALSSSASVTLQFNADRPGTDFAWLVDGKPAGQFVVTGSHLVEGHR